MLSNSSRSPQTLPLAETACCQTRLTLLYTSLASFARRSWHQRSLSPALGPTYPVNGDSVSCVNNIFSHSVMLNSFLLGGVGTQSEKHQFMLQGEEMWGEEERREEGRDEKG